MKKGSRKHTNIILKILKKISNAHDYDELLNLENYLVAFLISPICFLGSILNLIFRLIWGDPLYQILMTSFLMLFGGISILYIAANNWKHKYKIHSISAVSIMIVYTVIVSYYERMGILIWLVVFFLLLVALTRIEKTMLIYLSAASIVLFVHLYVFHMNETVILTPLYYYIQLGIIIFICAFSFIFNKLYRNIIKNNINHTKQVEEQNEEITALFEEVTAKEDELSAQNKQLMEYNDEIKSNEAKLLHMAYSDSLTELPNRKMLMEQLGLMVQLCSDNKSMFGIVFIDLDNFKNINDSLGHSMGDLLLCEVSNRLKTGINSNDILARLGGDEFALLVKSSFEEEELFTYIESLNNCLKELFIINENELHATASFGIAVFPQDGQTPEELLKSADTAMYKAKELGKSDVQFFRKEMKDEIFYKLDMQNKLMNSIKSDELYIEYQPKYDTNTLKLNGFEALLRWQNKDLGRISPAEFIPIAEETGLINEIGEWVLRKSCKKINEIKSSSGIGIPISVNVSAVQMNNSDFVSRVETILKEENIDPSVLELEITESVFINNIERAAQTILKLKKLGVAIALDDFGTGYSSLSYLKRLPIDVLKIDKSFIDDLEADNKLNPIVGSIISLIHEMNISVVAEGVETDYQLDYLKQKSCDIIQGFLISRPLGEKAMMDLCCKDIA